MSSGRGVSGQGESSVPKSQESSPEMNVSGLIINPCESQLNAIKNKNVTAKLLRIKILEKAKISEKVIFEKSFFLH